MVDLAKSLISISQASYKKQVTYAIFHINSLVLNEYSIGRLILSNRLTLDTTFFQNHLGWGRFVT